MPARTAPRYPYPRLNGNYFQHSSNIVTINSVPFYDIPDISGMGDETDPQKVNGLSRVSLGMTAGNNQSEDLQLTFFTTIWPYVENVLDPQGGGLYDSGTGGDNPLTIHIEMFEPGMPRQIRDWIGMRLIKVSESSSFGGEAMKTTATFRSIAMIRNGRNPVLGIDFGFTPNLLLIGNST